MKYVGEKRSPPNGIVTYQKTAIEDIIKVCELESKFKLNPDHFYSDD